MTHYEEKILGCLHYVGGTSTRDVAAQIGDVTFSRASHSALVLQALKKLERQGLVKRLDDALPIAWLLVRSTQEAA